MSEQIVTKRRDRSDPAELAPSDQEKEFRALAGQWRRETSHLSYLPQKYRHAAYQKILGMGKPAIPLILRDLQEQGGWWFDALAALTHEDPAREATGYDECRAAWLKWGKEKGFVA
jgi:hypothetical protein